MEVLVEATRGVALAKFEIVRPLTIIVGSNGSGKSTVLNQIRQLTFTTHIYIGPHRATRRQTARLRFMGQNMPTMGDIMSNPNMQGYEGVTITSGVRDAWELDEAGNFFKYNLSKLEFQRATAISRKFDELGAEDYIERSSISDVWSPLKDLTENLLPHMRFSRIETDNYDNMRCLFRVHGKEDEVDFDDLSSGEKSILQTLYPIIEPKILEKMRELVPGIPIPPVKTLIIFDEPELHLHPSLQEKIVSYLRSFAVENDMKVVLATHSPTIIDAADEDDILLLRPREAVPDGENQIVSLGKESQRLTRIQQAIGSVFPVTASRPLLLVEGAERVSVKSYSDKQIYTFLDPRFHRLNMKAGGGKDQCLRVLEGTRSILADDPYGIQLFALLDRDLEEADSPGDGAFHLPVCMVENLLLDVYTLREGFGAMLHQTDFAQDGALNAALAAAVDAAAAVEVARRFRRKLRVATFGPDRNLNSAEEAVAFRESFKQSLDGIDFQMIQMEAEDEVQAIIRENRQKELFSGKNIMNAFVSENVLPLHITKSTFIYTCAKATGAAKIHSDFFDRLFSEIGV